MYLTLEPRSRLPRFLPFFIAVLIILFFLIMFCLEYARAEVVGIASWYSVESCKREGTSGIMANGEVLRNEEFICASWDYKFGTRLKITNLANAKSVIVVVKDRGPARRLYRQGRIIDLSRSAFMEIANLKQGIIKIKVEIIK